MNVYREPGTRPEYPKENDPMSEVITLPSGMKGTVRAMTLDEAQLFANPKNIRSGESFEMLLKRCWAKTESAGCYPWLKEGASGAQVDWQKVLLGDRFVAMCEIRTVSLDDMYSFKVKCPRDDCEYQFEWELSLRDLERTDLPESSRQVLLNGENRFEIEVAGSKLAYKLATGAEEIELAKVRERLRHMGPVDMLKLQVLEVDGKPEAKEIRKFLGGLSLNQAREVTEAMQANDCGVKTNIEVKCDECGWNFEVELPFGEGFFRPTKKKPSNSRTSASGVAGL